MYTLTDNSRGGDYTTKRLSSCQTHKTIRTSTPVHFVCADPVISLLSLKRNIVSYILVSGTPIGAVSPRGTKFPVSSGDVHESTAA